MRKRMVNALKWGAPVALSLMLLPNIPVNAQEATPEPSTSDPSAPASGQASPTQNGEPQPPPPTTPGTGGPGMPGQEEAPPATVSDTKACPLYPFMFHNGYTSYYALYWSSTSRCTTPLVYTGVNGLSGNCATGDGCQDVLVTVDAATTADASAPAATTSGSGAGAVKINQLPEEIRKNGYTTEGEISLAPGVQRLHDDVKAIEFALDPNGQQTVKAKVKFGYLTKNQITLAAGIGTGLQANDTTTADRTAGKNEVITLERDRHAVRVLVRMTQSEWRELVIILPKGMGN